MLYTFTQLLLLSQTYTKSLYALISVGVSKLLLSARMPETPPTWFKTTKFELAKEYPNDMPVRYTVSVSNI